MAARWVQAGRYLSEHAPVQVAGVVRAVVVLGLLLLVEAPAWTAVVYGFTESATITWAQVRTVPLPRVGERVLR